MVIPIIILVIIFFYVLAVYNKMAAMRVRIKASIQEIGNQLKRQAELLPNLQALVKGATKQEREIFKMLTEARKIITEAIKSGSDKAIDASQEFLQKTLDQLKITVESNPQIQSINAIISIKEDVRDTVDKIMYARRVLIDLSADFNVMQVTFPSKIVAGIFGFKEAEGLKTPTTGAFLEVSEEETKPQKLDLEK